MCSGLTYCFSIYSLTVTTQLGYTESQVEDFALALNFGGYFAIPCGMIYEWLEPYDRLATRSTPVALNPMFEVQVYQKPVCIMCVP